MTVTVKVTDPYQVGHAGKVFGPGERVEVPARVAAVWLHAGWVVEIPPARRKVRTKAR